MTATRMPLASPPPMERRAEALAELQELYSAYETAQKQTEADARVIQRLQDRLELMREELTNEREQRRICERKLIRLAANQRNIHRISQDGDEIMRSVQEWEETAAEAATDEQSAREMAERFAPEPPKELNNVTSLETNKL
jgi:hypothetical protein